MWLINLFIFFAMSSDAGSNALPTGSNDGGRIAIEKTSDDEAIPSLISRPFVRMEASATNRFPLILEASRPRLGLPGSVTVAPDATRFRVSQDTPLDDGELLILNQQFDSSQDGENPWTNSFTPPATIGHNAGANGVTRHFPGRAGSANGWLPWSSVVSGADAPPDEATALVAISAGPTSISLSWTAPIETNSGPITGYRIERTPDGEARWTILVDNSNSTETTYTDTGLQLGDGFCYQVAAINSAGQGPYPLEPACTTTSVAAPGAPTALEATSAGPTSINLTWINPLNNGGSVLTGYKIEVSPNGTSSWTDLVANTGGTGTTYTHSGLAAVTTRYYRVSAINSVGTSLPSQVVHATTDTATAPGVPTSLSATADGRTAIDLSWTAPADNGGRVLTGYKIEVSPNGTSSWTTLAANTGGTGTTYTHSGLTAGTTSHYRVSAINSVGTGLPSQVVHATTDTATAPGVPTSLSATADGRTAIDLSWTAPADNGGSTITGYKIEVSPNGTSSWTNLAANTGGTGTTYTHSGLTAGTTRHYRVSAINSAGTGNPSSVANATTNTATAPGVPTALSATADGRTAIDLSWTAPADNGGSTITGYKIEVSPNGTSSWTNLAANTGGTGATYTHNGLTAGTTRHYRVSAINSAGTGNPSSVANATTDAATAPGVPTSLSATADGRTAIDLSWTAPADNGGADITGYKIEVSPNGTSSWTNLAANTGGTGTTYTHNGLTAGTTRHYRVSAINSAGTGNPSSVANATTDAATAPGVPTALSATADGRTAINLSWTAPADNGGADITGYKIEVSPNGTSSWTNLVANTGGTGTTYTHSGLAAVTTRHYRVSAINSAGTGNPSSVANATTDAATAPGVPTALSATADGRTAIDLSWTAPADNGGADITGYKIEVSTNAGTSWTDLVANTGETGTTYTDDNLAPETARHYRVSAINSVGTGNPSSVANATTDAVTAPGVPTALSATADGRTAIDLSWTAPPDNGGADITGYKIEVSANAGTSWTDLVANTGGTGTTYTDDNLAPETARHYRVSAINSVGTGNPSSVANATTEATNAAVPNAPTSLTATSAGSASINLSWTAPADNGGADITGYKIEVSTNAGTSWTDLVANTGETGTTYTDDNLAPETARHYRVSAINSVGTGNPSSVANATTDAVTAPGVPTALSATADGRTAIDLSWTAPADNGGADITGYKIEVSTNAGTSWTDLVANTGGTGTTYTDANLAPETTRHYRVSAINSAGTGNPSSVANATTDATNATVPNAPPSLTATSAGSASINLSWTAPADNGGADITGYKIEVSPNGTSSWTDLVANTGGTGTTYTHSGLAAVTTRHYRVSAINSAGTGNPSSVANATTDAATAPGVPTALSATADGRTAIDLSWTAPADNGGADITGYKIEVSTNAGTSWTDLVTNTGGTGTTYTHSGLADGTTRHYRVSAINSAGTGNPSSVANATTDATSAAVPNAPTSLTATSAGSASINLSWTAPADNGGADITGYKIEVSTNAGTSWTDLVANTGGTGTTYTDDNLAPETTRHYRVSAINSVGTGNPSSVANATTDAVTAPGVPTALSATADGRTAIDLSWTAPADNGGADITGYKIEVSTNTGTSWTDLVANTGETGTTYTDDNLAPETTRHYRVSAINSVGTGNPSNVAKATTGVSSALSLTGSVSNQFFPIGMPIADLVLPVATGGSAPYRYKLTPTVPAGLTFDAETRTISGTPSEITPPVTFTWKVEDAAGTKSSLDFSIEVYGISFTASIADQSYPRGQAIEPLVLPEVTGGVDPISYTFNVLSLPTGLRLDLPSRTISGTPVVVTPPVLFTYKAVDTNGARDSLAFSIEVVSLVNTEEETGLPQEFMVHSNYPNPFLHSTRLVFDLPWSAQIQVEVLDITGRRVYTKPVVNLTAGYAHEMKLSDLTLSSGTYLYHMIARSAEGNSSSVYVGHFVSIR